MRRLGILVLALVSVSLSTAMAASVDVTADNLSSFRQSVSISVPSRIVPFYLRNDPNQPPGNTVFVPGRLAESSTTNNAVEQKALVRDPLPVGQSQSDTAKYHAWQTVDQTAARVISGPATLYVDSNGGINQMTAGLFECWKGTATDPLPTSGTTLDADIDAAGGHGCVFITSATSTGGTSSSGYSERTVQFTFPQTTIEVGHRLRLKIVNNTASGWSLQWGFNSARSSQLQVTES